MVTISQDFKKKVITYFYVQRVIKCSSMFVMFVVYIINVLDNELVHSDFGMSVDYFSVQPLG